MATSSVTSTTSTATSTVPTTTSTSTSNTSSTSTATSADKSATGQSVLKALGGGSGIDTAALAQSLVDAERIPRTQLINDKITKDQAKISGYSAINYTASTLNDAFTALSNTSDFESLTVRNSVPTAFNVTTNAFATAADYQIDVQSLAKPQRALSDGFADASSNLSSVDFSLKLAVHGGAPTSIPITAAKSSPGDLVDAINSAGLGVSAQLVNTGDGSGNPYKIILTGTSGASKDFTLTSDDGSGNPVTGINFNTATPLQTATDATVVVNGVTIKRSSNSIPDAIKGVTLDLFTTTSGAATVNLARDTTALKGKFTTLVQAYNDAQSMMNVLADKNSTVAQYGGSLFGDSTVRTMKSMFKDLMLGGSNTPGTNATYLWQIGINLNKDGTIQIDQTKLDQALSSNFDNVVKMFTGGNNNGFSTFNTAPAGIGGEAVRKLTKLIASDGTLSSLTDSTNKQITSYQKDLSDLNDRMAQLLTRYQNQFAAMNSFVSQSQSTAKGLTSTFAGMANAYSGK